MKSGYVAQLTVSVSVHEALGAYKLIVLVHACHLSFMRWWQEDEMFKDILT